MSVILNISLSPLYSVTLDKAQVLSTVSTTESSTTTVATSSLGGCGRSSAAIFKEITAHLPLHLNYIFIISMYKIVIWIAGNISYSSSCLLLLSGKFRSLIWKSWNSRDLKLESLASVYLVQLQCIRYLFNGLIVTVPWLPHHYLDIKQLKMESDRWKNSN